MKSVKGKRGRNRESVPLNALALGVALGGMLIPLVTQSPAKLLSNAQSMLAAPGSTLSASVPANPYNTLSEQLAAKERALNEREDEPNAEAKSQTFQSPGEIFGFVSFGLSLVLLMLISFNFYLDSRRGKKTPVLSSKFSVDLR